MPDRAKASLKPFDEVVCNYCFSSAVVCRQQYQYQYEHCVCQPGKISPIAACECRMISTGGRHCLFSRGFDTVRNFRTKLLAYQVLIQQSLGKAFWSKMQFPVIQRDAICILHPCLGLCVSVPGEETTGWPFLHHGDPQRRLCLLRKRARAREQSYKKALLKTG